MTLRFLKNKEIDKSRWNEIVHRFANARMYSLSDYLDATSYNWAACIYGDYEAIMPLPYKSYLFGLFRKHYIPLFVQQLGIIDKTELSNERKTAMLKLASNQFNNFIHPFNHQNGVIEIDGMQSTQRTNYELDLNKSYEEIRAGYKNNLIRNLKSSKEEELTFSEKANWDSLERFILNYSQSNDPSPKNISTLNSIANISTKGFNNNIFQVNKGDDILAICMAPKFNNRITLLIPRSSPQGRELNAMAFLIDQIIQKYQGEEVILDFEGSMLPGVANFYQQFGAVNKGYYLVGI